MGLKFSNFGKAIIASAPSGVSGLSFSVEAGKGLLFPALGSDDYFYGILKDASGNREIVKVESRSVDSMTIAVGGRGLDGTVARSWAAGDYFVAGITNVALNESLSNDNLQAIGALPSAADRLAYFSGAGQAALSTLTAFARTLLASADAAAMRTLLGVELPFPAGTSQPFFNPTAPPGWTHDLTALNHALRLVAGAGAGANAGGASGGTVAFTTAFTMQAVAGVVGGRTITEAQTGPHRHGYERAFVGSGNGLGGSAPYITTGSAANTGYAGGGEAHDHAFTGTEMNLAVSYVNMIRATKD